MTRQRQWVYTRALLVGIAIGLPVWVCLTRWYRPPRLPVLIRAFSADFEWDSGHGFKSFKVRDRATEPAGGRLWQYLVAAQIKPRLDSYLRQDWEEKARGRALVEVVKVVPLALPGGWRSGGMDLEDPLETPLMRAAAKGDVASVRGLLAEGADANARDRSGRTPLLHAFSHGRASLGIVAALLAAGADPNGGSNDGSTPLLTAWAAPPGERPAIVAALLAAGACIKAEGRGGETPLHSVVGAFDADAQTVRTLLAAGSDVNARDADGDTPLLGTEKNRSLPASDRLAIVRELLAAHADINARDREGMTPLMLEAIRGDVRIIEALLGAGAKPDARNNRGDTALSVAERKGDRRVANVLRKAGATL